jgi:tetratricopeptide (TPR) repeat protein
MELVRGIPITDYCDRERLSIPERLELFVLVCRAVQHAHQKGIIHRDLKPSNILVTVIDAAAVPKVIDFGVAKAMGQQLTERTLYTAFHQFVGTPLYMSPEQANLAGMDVDTRSDIYSLGVLLYELLTGTTPFDRETVRKAAFDEVRRIIREQEPPKPSTRISTLGETLTDVSAKRGSDPRRLRKVVRGELDWIVMKALEKDRNRRYETANGLAADVRRYLEDEPVQACPPSAWYRLSKAARRNRAALVTAALVGTSLVVGTAVSTWQAVRARAAERRATERSRLARQAVDEMYAEFAKSVLGAKSRLRPVQRHFLEKALALYQRFAEEDANDPDVKCGMAILYRDLGERQRAVELLEEVVAHSPGVPKYRVQLGDSYQALGGAQKDPAARERAYRQALAIWEALAADPATRAVALTRKGAAYISLAGMFHGLRQYQKAEQSIHDYIASRAALRDEFPLPASDSHVPRIVPWVPRDEPLIANNASLWAAILIETGRTEEAERVYREGLFFMERDEKRLREAGYPYVEYARGVRFRDLMGLGNLLAEQGRLPEAKEVFRQSLDVGEALAADTDEAEHKNMLAWIMATCPVFQIRDPAKAVEHAQKTVEREPRRGPYWTTLGVALYRAGEWKAATDALGRSMELRNGGDSFDWFFLAMAHWQLGDRDQARTWYDKSVTWMEKNNPRDVELRCFRAEAAALLSVADLPDDVFAPP